MSDVFAAALGALHASPLATPATYTPPGGPARPGVRIIFALPSELGGGARLSSATADVTLAGLGGVPPVKGATFVLEAPGFSLPVGTVLKVEDVDPDDAGQSFRMRFSRRAAA